MSRAAVPPDPPKNLRAIYYNMEYAIFAWEPAGTSPVPTGYFLEMTPTAGGSPLTYDWTTSPLLQGHITTAIPAGDYIVKVLLISS